MPVTRAGHRWRTQVVGLWWLLIPLTMASLDWWMDAWMGKEQARWIFYGILGLGIFAIPELLPALIRLPWSARLVVGALLGLLVGVVATKLAFLLLPSERARLLNTWARTDILTVVEVSLGYSFIMGNWLIGAVYLTFGRFRESPWRRQSQDPARSSDETAGPMPS